MSQLKSFLDDLKQQHRYRSLKTVSSDQGPVVKFEGKDYINFSSNNYLGLANSPELIQASIEATQKFGTGSGASRLITGSMSLHENLESKLAEFKGTETSLVFNSGFQANIGIISSLMKEGDVIFSDELNHASIIDGCRLSKAKTFIYKHLDLNHLEDLLKQHQSKNRLIVTDSVFSMDGDLAPLVELMDLAERYDSYLLVDEAHATGVFGINGSGLISHCGIDPRKERLIQMGTLGKALGSFGAYVACSQILRDYFINTARTFIYSTSLPPSVLAASIKAIEIIQGNPKLLTTLWDNVNALKRILPPKLASKNLSVSAIVSPIIPIIVGQDTQTMKLADDLFDNGLWITGIRPPTVPNGTARLRLTLTAAHTQFHLDRLFSFFD